MAYRLPSYLHRNRHGTLYFRLTVPDDIRHLFGQRELYRSLNTSSVRKAADAAQALRIAFRGVFETLRNTTMQEKETFSTIDAARLRDTIRAAKEKLKLRDRIEVLEEAAIEQHRQALRERDAARQQHERELDIAIRSKGGDPAKGKGKPFSEASAEFLEAQKKATTRKTYKGRLEHAQEFYGAEKDIRHIEQADLSAYARHALKTIANPTTAGFHITTLCGLLNRYRIQEGWGDPLTTKTLIPKKETPDTEDRDPFTPAQLQKLFQNAIKYKDSQPHKYWATIATAFTGCRIEELAQINLLTDLGLNDASGVWYLDLNAKPDPDGVIRKSMKNKASWRRIPLHSALVKHGLVDYLKEQVKAGFTRPFEAGWKPHQLKGSKALKWSHYITNWGGRELKKLIDAGTLTDPDGKLSYFHSMRHTLSQCMGRARIPPEICEATLGHAYAGSERERYHKLKSDPDQLFREGVEPGLVELAILLERR